MLLAFGFCCGCSPQGIAPVRGIYYWRTTFQLSPFETESLKQLEFRKLYLRVADVVRDRATGQIAPRAKIELFQPLPSGVEVIPVVYLKNEVFETAPGDPGLAGHLRHLLVGLEKQGGFKAHEVQIDCDWTERTRDRYFHFCRDLGSLLHERGTKLSATIRLHQVKYRELTGTPPVDRGMLMFYNMGSVTQAGYRNSIFDQANASRYLGRLASYPLPLDAAVPIYSWVVHFRYGRVVELIEKWPEAELASQPGLERLAPGQYRCTASQYLHGRYLMHGDRLVVEAIDRATQQQIARILRTVLKPREPLTLSLFDLDERNPTLHAFSDIETIFDRFPAAGAGPLAHQVDLGLRDG